MDPQDRPIIFKAVECFHIYLGTWANALQNAPDESFVRVLAGMPGEAAAAGGRPAGADAVARSNVDPVVDAHTRLSAADVCADRAGTRLMWTRWCSWQRRPQGCRRWRQASCGGAWSPAARCSTWRRIQWPSVSWAAAVIAGGPYVGQNCLALCLF